MSTTNFEHPAESTRLQTNETFTEEEPTVKCSSCTYECNSDTLMICHMKTHSEQRNFSCDKCDYRTSSMDENVNHENSLNVTVIQTAIDEIVDLPTKKRKNTGERCNRSNVKKMKYKLHD